jgi:hypothetical protein
MPDLMVSGLLNGVISAPVVVADANGTGNSYGARRVTRPVVTLTDAATVAVDASLGEVFRLSLGGNRTMGAPTNPEDGQEIELEVTNVGTNTLAWNAAFLFTAGSAPTITASAGKTDIIGFRYRSSDSKWLNTYIKQNL